MILETIQTQQKLNEVEVLGESSFGGAYHNYDIFSNKDNSVLLHIHYQEGTRNSDLAKDGILDSDLLEIVRHRLQSFQAGEYASEYNAEALVHVEAALTSLNQRVEDRIARQVLGTMEK